MVLHGSSHKQAEEEEKVEEVEERRVRWRKRRKWRRQVAAPYLHLFVVVVEGGDECNQQNGNHDGSTVDPTTI